VVVGNDGEMWVDGHLPLNPIPGYAGKVLSSTGEKVTGTNKKDEEETKEEEESGIDAGICLVSEHSPCFVGSTAASHTPTRLS